MTGNCSRGKIRTTVPFGCRELVFTGFCQKVRKVIFPDRFLLLGDFRLVIVMLSPRFLLTWTCEASCVVRTFAWRVAAGLASVGAAVSRMACYKTSGSVQQPVFGLCLIRVWVGARTSIRDDSITNDTDNAHSIHVSPGTARIRSWSPLHKPTLKPAQFGFNIRQAYKAK